MKTDLAKRQYQNAYRKANADRIRAYQKAYRDKKRADNPGYNQAYLRAYRARRKVYELAIVRLLNLHSAKELTLEKASSILEQVYINAHVNRAALHEVTAPSK